MGFLDLFRAKYKHSNWQVRLKAISQIQDNQIVLKIARQDENQHVRESAADELLKRYEKVLSESDVVAIITKAIISKIGRCSREFADESCRNRAITLLIDIVKTGKLSYPVIKLSECREYEKVFFNEVIQEIIQSNDARVLTFLIEILKEKNYGDAPKSAAIAALSTMSDDRAVKSLVDFIKTGQGDKFAAIAALCKMRDEHALIDVLNYCEFKINTGEHNYFSAMAAEVIAELGQAVSAESIAQWLNHKNFGVRSNIAVALARKGDARGIDVIVELLRSMMSRSMTLADPTDSYIQDFVSKIRLLGSLKDRLAAPILRSVISQYSGVGLILRPAAEALKATGDPEGVCEAEKILKDMIPEVCKITFPFGSPYDKTPLTVTFVDGLAKFKWTSGTTWIVGINPLGKIQSTWYGVFYDGSKCLKYIVKCPECGVEWAAIDGVCKACGKL